MLSCVRLFATSWTEAGQAPLSMGFSRQEHWSGLPFPSPRDLPDLGMELGSPALQADSLPSEPPGSPRNGETQANLWGETRAWETIKLKGRIHKVRRLWKLRETENEWTAGTVVSYGTTHAKLRGMISYSQFGNVGPGLSNLLISLGIPELRIFPTNVFPVKCWTNSLKI